MCHLRCKFPFGQYCITTHGTSQKYTYILMNGRDRFGPGHSRGLGRRIVCCYCCCGCSLVLEMPFFSWMESLHLTWVKLLGALMTTRPLSTDGFFERPTIAVTRFVQPDGAAVAWAPGAAAEVGVGASTDRMFAVLGVFVNASLGGGDPAGASGGLLPCSMNVLFTVRYIQLCCRGIHHGHAAVRLLGHPPFT